MLHVTGLARPPAEHFARAEITPVELSAAGAEALRPLRVARLRARRVGRADRPRPGALSRQPLLRRDRPLLAPPHVQQLDRRGAPGRRLPDHASLGRSPAATSPSRPAGAGRPRGRFLDPAKFGRVLSAKPLGGSGMAGRGGGVMDGSLAEVPGREVCVDALSGAAQRGGARRPAVPGLPRRSDADLARRARSRRADGLRPGAARRPPGRARAELAADRRRQHPAHAGPESPGRRLRARESGLSRPAAGARHPRLGRPADGGPRRPRAAPGRDRAGRGSRPSSCSAARPRPRSRRTAPRRWPRAIARCRRSRARSSRGTPRP